MSDLQTFRMISYHPNAVVTTQGNPYAVYCFYKTTLERSKEFHEKMWF